MLSAEKVAEVKLQLLELAKNMPHSSFDDMMVIYGKLKVELGVA